MHSHLWAGDSGLLRMVQTRAVSTLFVPLYTALFVPLCTACTALVLRKGLQVLVFRGMVQNGTTSTTTQAPNGTTVQPL